MMETKTKILTAFSSFLPTDMNESCNEQALDGYVRCFEEVYTAAIIKDGDDDFILEALDRVRFLFESSTNDDFKCGAKLFLKALFTFI